MGQALPVAYYDVRCQLQLSQGFCKHRRFPKGQQAGYVGKPGLTFGQADFLHLKLGVPEDNYGRTNGTLGVGW